MSTAARRANEKPEPDGLWFTLSSGEWIRTTDLRVIDPGLDQGGGQIHHADASGPAIRCKLGQGGDVMAGFCVPCRGFRPCTADLINLDGLTGDVVLLT